MNVSSSSATSISATGIPATSISALILQRAREQGAKTILRRKDRGIWKAINWTHLAYQVQQIGVALVANGLTSGDTAAVMSETRPEAVYADLAIQSVGAVSIMIHPEEAAGRIEHMLRASNCRLVFVESEEQLDRVLTLRDRCPALARIVIFDMKGLRDFSDRQCVSLSAFVMGHDTEVDWYAMVDAVQPDQPAILLFPPQDPFPQDPRRQDPRRQDHQRQGRILTHRDVQQMLADARARLLLTSRDERLAVLAMADISERIWGLYVALDAGCISNYLESPDTAAENLQELQPTVLGADADAWSHLHARATRSAKVATTTQRIAYKWALRVGRRGGIGAVVARLLVLHAVRRELGLGKLRLAYVAGEPVDDASLDWTKSLGIAIQRIDERLPADDQTNAQYQTRMQSAHA